MSSRGRRLSAWRRPWLGMGTPCPVYEQPHLPPTVGQMQQMATYAVGMKQETPRSAFECRWEAQDWLSWCWDAEVRARGDLSRMPSDLAADYERRTLMVRQHQQYHFGFNQETWDRMVADGRGERLGPEGG